MSGINSPHDDWDAFEEIEKNRYITLKYSLLHFVKYYLSSLIVIFISSYLFNVNLNWKSVLAIIIIPAIIIFFEGKKYYKDLFSLMNVYTHIHDIKKRSNPKGNLRKQINIFTMSIERSKLLLDLLKSFSPIPIIVFIFGIIFSTNNAVILSLINTHDALTVGLFSIKTVISIIIILFITFYLLAIISTYERYKYFQLRGLEYQNAYDELKEDDESKKEQLKKDDESKSKKEQSKKMMSQRRNKRLNV